MSVQVIGSGTIGGIDEGLVVSGIVTATARLDVGNNGTNAVDLRFRTNRGSAGQTIANLNYEWNGTTVAQIRGIAGSDTTNKDDGHLAFFTTPAGNGSFSERLRIGSTGNVHIGSGDPTIAKLQVSGAGFFGSANTTKTNDGVIIERNTSDGIAHIVAGRSGGNYSGFKFFVAGASGVTLRNEIDYQSNIKWFGADGTTERVRIGVNGGVGIGTNYLSGNNSVYHKLMVEGDTTSQIAVAKILRRHSSASNGTYTLEVDSSSHTSNMANGGAMSVDVNSGRAFTIDGTGDVGIGTITPLERVHIHKSSATGPFMYITNTSTGVSASDGIQIGYDGTNTAVFKNNEPTDSVFYAGSQSFRITSSGHVLPDANNTQDLGSSSKRWRNVYTTDLQLSNKGKTNDVDNTWGDYTIQEGESDLFLINNRNGKKYKFNLTEVS